MNDEVTPVLLILPAPDKLRVEVGVAVIPHFVGRGIVLFEHRLVLGGGNVFPFGVVVFEGFDGFERGRFLGHDYLPSVAGCAAAASIMLLNWLATLALKSASI